MEDNTLLRVLRLVTVLLLLHAFRHWFPRANGTEISELVIEVNFPPSIRAGNQINPATVAPVLAGAQLRVRINDGASKRVERSATSY